MRILICNGCWAPNIGNAFVNIGTEQIVKQVFGNCEIIYSANVSNKWYFGIPTNSADYVNNSFNIFKYMNVDLVVWGGMMLTKHFVELLLGDFLEFSKRKIPILFLGAGMDEYTAEEADCVANALKRMDYVGIVTRDDKTYDMLSEYSFLKWKIVKGIDAAFFVSDYKAPELEIEAYDVECFDRIVTPYIEHGKKRVIMSHHDCFGKLPIRYIKKENTLISELPYDYLTLYKNVDTTYTERVHACIASLAYGNKARLYSTTPRAALFGRLIENGEEKIRNGVVSIDKQKLEKEKQRVLKNTKILYEALKKLILLENIGGGIKLSCCKFILRHLVSATESVHIAIILRIQILQVMAKG